MVASVQELGTRKGGPADEVLNRYGRLLALSCAIELGSSEDTSRRIAKAIRDEAGALCGRLLRLVLVPPSWNERFPWQVARRS